MPLSCRFRLQAALSVDGPKYWYLDALSLQIEPILGGRSGTPVAGGPPLSPCRSPDVLAGGGAGSPQNRRLERFSCAVTATGCCRERLQCTDYRSMTLSLHLCHSTFHPSLFSPPLLPPSPFAPNSSISYYRQHPGPTSDRHPVRESQLAAVP
ncbi:hypothetical protein TgHK011_005321 [Trichoderma gracile]|nr:hypothetical protein TgHK011_005321 [Trichoderma gracile]